jgi:hypothetical protein
MQPPKSYHQTVSLSEVLGKFAITKLVKTIQLLASVLYSAVCYTVLSSKRDGLDRRTHMITRIGVDWYQNESEDKQYFVWYVESGKALVDSPRFTDKAAAISRASQIVEGKQLAEKIQWVIQEG